MPGEGVRGGDPFAGSRRVLPPPPPSSAWSTCPGQSRVHCPVLPCALHFHHSPVARRTLHGMADKGPNKGLGHDMPDQCQTQGHGPSAQRRSWSTCRLVVIYKCNRQPLPRDTPNCGASQEVLPKTGGGGVAAGPGEWGWTNRVQMGHNCQHQSQAKNGSWTNPLGRQTPNEKCAVVHNRTWTRDPF